MEYHSAIKKEILPFATTWMDLVGIMLRKNKPGGERQIPYDFTYLWNINTKQNRMNKIAVDSQTLGSDWWLPWRWGWGGWLGRGRGIKGNKNSQS